MVYPISYYSYGKTEQTQWTNVLRGGAKQPVTSVIQPSFKGVQTPAQDVVQISAGDKIKNTSNTEKAGMSTGVKWALGILGTAAAVYGAIVGHRMLTKPTIEKVAQNFSEIFRRDVSKEEAQKMVNNYKELFQINDKKEFCQKLFNQAKKDFGYEKLDLRMAFLSEESLLKNPKLSGGYRPITPVFVSDGNGNNALRELNSEIISLNLNNSREKIFDTIMHEFTHCKQHEIAYRYDKDKFFDAMFERRFSGNKKLLPHFNRYKEVIELTYKDVWDKLPKIQPGTKEGDLAEIYLKELRIYKSGTSGNIDEYWNQVLEQEARKAGGKTKLIYKYLNMAES